MSKRRVRSTTQALGTPKTILSGCGTTVWARQSSSPTREKRSLSAPGGVVISNTSMLAAIFIGLCHAALLFSEGTAIEDGKQKQHCDCQRHCSDYGVLIGHYSSPLSFLFSLIAAKFIQARMLGTQRPMKMAASSNPKNQITIDATRESTAATLNRNSERERFIWSVE